MVRIDHTSSNTEILLFVPSSLKERAKRVSKCSWDPTRKAWIFPRNRDIYNSLCREFADEMANTQPAINNHITNQEANEVTKLRAEILELSKELRNSTPKEHLETIKRQNNVELKQLKNKIKELENENASISKKLNSVNDNYKNELNRQVVPSEDEIFTFIKALAIESSNNDKVLILTLERLNLDEKYLPLEIAKIVEYFARSLLGYKDESIKFHEVLEIIKEKGLMNEQALNLAHFIRKQRNYVAHSEIKESASKCRSILLLTALSLFWGEFPKH